VPLGEVLAAAFGSVWLVLVLLAADWSLDGWAYDGDVDAAELLLAIVLLLVELLAAA
jgi:hypothetical protein